VLVGRTGLFAPPASFIADEIPLQAGARVRSAKHQVREVDLPLFLQAADAPSLRTRVRTLLRALDPTRGDGKLRVTPVVGDERELTCRYAGGLELAETQELSGVNWVQAVATFRAWDPYWVSRLAQTVILTPGGSTVPWFPFFPLALSNDTLVGGFTVTNAGDVEAWPVWTFTGPGVDPVLTNTTTGAVLTLALTLLATDTLTIDTRPGMKTVTLQDGTNLFGAVNTASAFWSLLPGDNALTVAYGSTTSASQVQLSYTARYLSI
jgi:phage-related protein